MWHKHFPGHLTGEKKIYKPSKFGLSKQIITQEKFPLATHLSHTLENFD